MNLHALITDVLGRVAAAREEIQISEYEQADAILADLEVDLCSAREGNDP